jgi:hypothetical protein
VKPLTEQVQQLDGVERQLAELFAAAEPTRSDPFRKRRILVRLSKQTLTRRSAWRPAIIVTMMLGATAAAATVGRGPLKTAWNGLWTRHQNEVQPTVLQTPQHPINFVTPSLSEPIALPIVPAEHPSPQPAAVQEAAASTVTTRPHSTAEPMHSASSEDPSQVLSAIRALRNEHNPARAKTLLNRYLQTHPQGALTEDALALSIEAAVATNDPKSSDIARTYMARYPNGRYRSLAMKALSR